MWSHEVSLRFWAVDRVVWSLSTSPPCRGFCCLFAALQTRAPLSWVLGRRRAALGHRHWKHGPSSVPRTDHLGSLSGGTSGYSMARPSLLVAGVIISFLWAPFGSPLPGPCPAHAMLQDGTGSCYCNKNKRKAEGKNNYNKKTPFFSY